MDSWLGPISNQTVIEMNFFIQREYFELICRTFISLYTEKKVQDLICNNFHSEIASKFDK